MSRALRKRLPTLKHTRGLPGWLTKGLAWLVWLHGRSLRVEIQDPDGVMEGVAKGPTVFTIWHNRLLCIPACLPAGLPSKLVVLISASRDGEYASNFARNFGIRVVRGSSSNRGTQAVRELRSNLREGFSAVVTLDGPRGPRYEVQPGAAVLALLSGVTVTPTSLNAPSRWELKSWDRMQIPKPFSKVVLRIGPRVYLGKDGKRPSREQACQQLHDLMMAMTHDSTA